MTALESLVNTLQIFTTQPQCGEAPRTVFGVIDSDRRALHVQGHAQTAEKLHPALPCGISARRCTCFSASHLFYQEKQFAS